MAHYKELIVWQKSIELVVAVYRYTKTFPTSGQFGLTSQMRRAAVSIPSNIAEGSRRKGKDTLHFLLSHSVQDRNLRHGSRSAKDFVSEILRITRHVKCF